MEHPIVDLNINPVAGESHFFRPAHSSRAPDPGFEADDEPFDQQAWDAWYCERIRRSLADPRPPVPHEEVMARAWQIICAWKDRHDGKDA